MEDQGSGDDAPVTAKDSVEPNDQTAGSPAPRTGRGLNAKETYLTNWALDWKLANGFMTPASVDTASEGQRLSRRVRRANRTTPRTASAFSKRQGELGISLAARLRMVEVLSGKDQEFFEGLRNKGKGLSKQKLSLDKRIDLTLRWYGEHIRRIDRTIFATAVFDGASAVEDLHRWMTEGEMRLGHRVRLLPKRDFHETPERKKALSDAIQFLNKDTLTPILIVEGDGMGEGLRAFAGALCKRLVKEDRFNRAVLYLPISRAAPLSQNVDERLRSQDPPEEKVSYPRMVGQLLAFFRNANFDPEAPALNSHEIRSALDFIRSEMARKPCILVLDCWAAFSGPLPALGSLLVDDGLNALLDELVHPYRAPDQPDIEPGTFLKNRFVVLAATEKQIVNPFVGERIPLPEPDSSDMAAIVRSQGRARLSKLAPLLETKRTELILALTHYLANLEDLPEGQAVEPDPVRFPKDEDPLRARVVADIRARPLANLVFTIVTLMPDGVRRSTLERLIATWREIWPLEPLNDVWDIGAASAGDLKAVMELLSPIIVTGTDDFVRGLDGRALDMRHPGLAANPSPADREYFDFSVPRMREFFAKRLVVAESNPRMERKAIARLHRMMSELALAGYNSVVLHGDWRDADARFYRRLFQAGYHGLCSLAVGAKTIDKAIRGLRERALPTEPSHAYRRLYSVLYRELLEAPPSWYLSRTLGRDDIKVDYLLLMMHVDDGQPWTWLMVNNKRQPTIAKFLEKEFTSTWNAPRAMAVDQLTSLAKAALRNNELLLAAQAVELGKATVLKILKPDAESDEEDDNPTDTGADGVEASHDDFEALSRDLARLDFDTSVLDAELERRLTPATSPDWSPALRSMLALDRINIDIAIVTNEKDIVVEVGHMLTGPMVETFGFPRTWFQLLERMRDGLAPAMDMEARVRRRLDVLERLARSADVETLSAWSDLMGLFAEIHVIEAEQSGGAAENRQGRFLLAYILLTGADRLRRVAFDREPLRRDYHLNPHSSRVLVRTLVQLTKYHRRTRDALLAAAGQCEADGEEAAAVALRDDAQRHDAAGDFFYDQAQRQFGILERFVGSFATERPSLLILKSGLVRAREPDSFASLTEAEGLLSEADRLMTAATHRPRVRLRLLRERSKVYRLFCGVCADAERGRTYSELAFQDIDRLYRLAEHAQLHLWIRIAVRQWKKMVDALQAAQLAPPNLPGIHPDLLKLGFGHGPATDTRPSAAAAPE